MPLPRIRTLLLMLSLLTLFLLLCYLSVTLFTPPTTAASPGQATSSFLFPPSAIISLADDNNTFFISRPAAFGPPLPRGGLNGELFVLEESQLACDDTPGWDPSASLVNVESPPEPTGDVRDDGTDDILNPAVPSTIAKSTAHADIESIQQSVEIGGKIVLVARGGCGFLEKVLWTQRRGGVALIVGDYKRSGIGTGAGLVTMYAKGDTSNVTIPSTFTSYAAASILTSLLPKRPPSAKPSSSPDLYHPPDYPLPSRGAPPQNHREGLWITLTPTNMTSSPFFDTLLVLVVSPLVTLTIVYTLLLVRSRIRRRRWRAPKSIVERLPVRTYQAVSSTSQSPQAPAFPPRSSSLHTIPQPPANTVTIPQPPSISVSPPLRQSSASAPPANTGWFARRGWSGSNECVVCLEEYVDGVSRVMKLPCGHEFHAECITPWLTTRRRTCPICKGDVVRGCKAAEAEGVFPETAGEGADERTPLVLGIDEGDHMDEPETSVWARSASERGDSSAGATSGGDWRV